MMGNKLMRSCFGRHNLNKSKTKTKKEENLCDSELWNQALAPGPVVAVSISLMTLTHSLTHALTHPHILENIHWLARSREFIHMKIQFAQPQRMLNLK